MCVRTTLPSLTMSTAESAADSVVQTSKRKGIIMAETKQTQDLIFIFKAGVAEESYWYCWFIVVASPMVAMLPTV